MTPTSVEQRTGRAGVGVGGAGGVGEQVDRAPGGGGVDVLRDLSDADDDRRTGIDHCGDAIGRAASASVASTGHAGSPRAALSRQIDRYGQRAQSVASATPVQSSLVRMRSTDGSQLLFDRRHVFGVGLPRLGVVGYVGAQELVAEAQAQPALAGGLVEHERLHLGRGDVGDAFVVQAAGLVVARVEQAVVAPRSRRSARSP